MWLRRFPHILDEHRQIAEGAVPQLPPQFSPQKADAPCRHTVPWEGSAAAIPTLTASTHTGPCPHVLCPSPACAAVVMANGQDRGWRRDEKCFICISTVRRVGKVTQRSPSITRRARYLPSPLELRGCGGIKYLLTKRNWITCLGEP